MPELPEVETVRRTLAGLVRGKTIDAVDVRWTKIIKRPEEPEEFARLLAGQTIQSIGRRGKFLLFHLDDCVMVSHLRMEGKYGLHQNDEPLDKHVHVIFRFTDGSELRYRDVRKFGTMHLFKPGEELTELPLRQLGPEPFSSEFTADYLRERLKKTNRSVKPRCSISGQSSDWAIFMSTRLCSEPVSIPRQQRTSSQKTDGSSP